MWWFSFTLREIEHQKMQLSAHCGVKTLMVLASCI